MTVAAPKATTVDESGKVVVVVSGSSNDHPVTQPPASSEESMEEDVDDGNYVKSASPSSSSVDSDETDEFIPNKKPAKRPAKVVTKKEKAPSKKRTAAAAAAAASSAAAASDSEAPPKSKSKLVASVNAKETKRGGAIKLKIEKKKEDASSKKEDGAEQPQPKSSKKEDGVETKAKKESISVEDRLKMKRKLKADKEKEKFAKFKQIRDKKDKSSKEKRDDVSVSKDRSREERERALADKLRGDLSKLIPKSIDKIGRIPKKPRDPAATAAGAGTSAAAATEEHASVSADDKSKNEFGKPKSASSSSSKVKEIVGDASKHDKEAKRTLPVPPKKPVSMSVEKRFAAEEKPKTVKAYNSKFRLTGLEQEVIPKPPARKSAPSVPAAAGAVSPSNSASTSVAAASAPVAVAVPPPTSPAPAIASPSFEKNSMKRSPPKDVEIEPAEKKMKSPDVSISEASPVSSKNKKPFLQESDFFMNAMNSALETQKESLRKRKKSAATKADGEAKSEEGSSRKNSEVSSSPTAKSEKEVKPTFKFYKDTMDTTNEENVHENMEAVDIKISPEELSALEDIKNMKIKADSSPPKTSEGLKSALSIFRGKRLPKKSVKWKRDDELEAVQYFEVDASERTNVVRTFWDMQMMERTKERESMLMVRKNVDNDKMAVQTKWKIMIPIDVPPSSIVRGSNSQEKNIQYARERAVPPALYFNKSMVPDTPAEPDLEIHPVTVPPVIPLDDISGSQDSISDFSAFKWPEPKTFAPDGTEMGVMAPGFLPNAAGLPQIFPPFPPPFGQPFFPGAPVPPANWTPTGNGEQNSTNQNSIPMNWPPPPNMVPPPVGPPGMIGPPPPFGIMGPPFPPLPGPGFPGAPNIFPPPSMGQQPISNNGAVGSNSSSNADNGNQSYSSGNNYSSGNAESGGGGGGGGGGSSGGGSGSGGSSSRKWNSDDRYSSRKDGWKNNYSDRNRDKRSNWRSNNRDSRLCRTYQKKGYCNISGCRFYHDDD